MKISLLIMFLFSVFHTISQGDREFVIGTFGYKPKKYFDPNCGNNIYYATKYDVNGLNSSTLNLYSEDGFTHIQEYAPHEWSIFESEKNRLLCAHDNGLKILFGGGNYYQPSSITQIGTLPHPSIPNQQIANYSSVGVNIFDNCGNPISNCHAPKAAQYFRTDINNYIDNMFSQSPFKEMIWGYHMAEEPEHSHPVLITSNCACPTGCVWTEHAPANNPYWKNMEVPAPNIGDAFDHYLNRLSTFNVTNHKMILMSSRHHQMINDLTTDAEGIYNTPDYINIIKNKSNAVFFEGSYAQFPSQSYGNLQPAWYNQVYSGMFNNGHHYLGSMKSIDYAKGKMTEVHNVISVQLGFDTGYAPSLEAHLHSDALIKNANWMWFQAYTSIIHGVDGVWLYGNNDAWGPNENENWDDTSVPDRFSRTNAPAAYNNFVGPLAKELRYLKNNGFLALDEESRLFTKLDHADLYCIVPPSVLYLPQSYDDPSTNQTIDLDPLFASNGDNFTTEEYGLRYTIKTNGTEVIMIISNPLPLTIDNVVLNFGHIPDPRISNATGVEVLFESMSTTNNPTSSSFKVNRNSNIDLINNTVGVKHTIPFNGTSANLSLSFGPMDTKILKFTGNSAVVVNPDNEWDKINSNNFSGLISNWQMVETDKYYQGDFNGNGREELIIVRTPNVPTSIMNCYEYNENSDTWNLTWTSGTTDDLLNYRNNLVVGDYDGDGKDELLGINSSVMRVFKFISGNFVSIWSDNGNHSITPYKNKVVAGDFDGDGSDEILGFDLFSGWTTLFHFQSNDFQWGWSNYGTYHSIDDYSGNLRSGDFDGDGKDELFGQASWATLYKYNNTTHDWDWFWSNYGSNSFGGWTYPLAPDDELLIGDITKDGKDDILFIQNGSGANSSRLMTLNNNVGSGWHSYWLASNATSPYINDFPIYQGLGDYTKYFLIKARNNRAEHLGALRGFKLCGNSSLSNSLQSLYYWADDILGLEDIKSENKASEWDISAYPNPTTGIFTLTSTDINISNAKVKVFSLAGKLLLDERTINNQNQIDLSTFENGTYLVQLIAEDRSFFTKVVLLK